MFDKIKEMIDQLYPIKIISMVVPEKLSAEYESCLWEISTLNQFITISTEKEREKLRQQAKEALSKVTAIWQFIINKTAPDEYKSLNDPCPPVYSTELRKITYTIAEKETIKLRESLKAASISTMLNAVHPKLGNK